MYHHTSSSTYENAEIYVDLLTGFPSILKPNEEAIQLKWTVEFNP